jgi:aromatic-L-amino-acid/L-tryptophan decarboxylase
MRRVPRPPSAQRARPLTPVPLQTLCVRHEPPGLSSAALDQHTLAWVERLHQTGRAWVTPAQLDGRWMVRLSIGSLTTERHHLETLWRDLQAVIAN